MSSPVPTRDASNWIDFEQIVTPLVEQGFGDSRHYVFRGQACIEWSLEPLLTRIASRVRAELKNPRSFDPLFYSNAVMHEFRARAHLHVPATSLPANGDHVAWLVLAQHFGVPTRLLDWTSSPYVAAYFAAADCPDKDGVMWIVSKAHVNRPKDSGVDAAHEEIHGEGEQLELITGMRAGERMRAIIFHPSRHHARTIAQQALFSITSDVMEPHDQAMSAVLAKWTGTDRSLLQRVRIPAAAKPEIMRRLRIANVTAESLFPGLDGLGRSLREYMPAFAREIEAYLRAAVEQSRP